MMIKEVLHFGTGALIVSGVSRRDWDWRESFHKCLQNISKMNIFDQHDKLWLEKQLLILYDLVLI